MAGIWDSQLKEGYSYILEDAVLDEESKNLILKTRSNFVVSVTEQHKAEYLLKEADRSLNNVDFIFEYEKMVQREEEYLPLFVEKLLEENYSEYSYLLKTCNLCSSSFSGKEIKLSVVGDIIAKLLNEKMVPILKREIKKNFSMEPEISFENHKDRYEEAVSKIKVYDKISKVPLSNYGWTKKTFAHENSNGGMNLLFGKNFSGKAVELDNIQPDMKSVIIEGKIFKIVGDEKPKKDGGTFVPMLILITDGKSSFGISKNMDPKEWKSLSENIKVGDFIEAKGRTYQNTYLKSVVLDARSMKKKEAEINRMDMSPEKRVELHAHTKMSAMDAVNNPADLVKLASKWGHKAIAITDHGVVQAFPEAAEAGRATGIKVIYGMEGYLLEDKNLIDEEGNIDYKGANTDHIIILAKNREGLKNLYKLVSFSHLDYFYKKPRIPKSILRKYREGLILGSACEAGEVFRAVVQEFIEKKAKGLPDAETTERLEEVASFYDYLEIMPVINNDYLTKDSLNKNGEITGKKTVENYDELRELNRRVVELGEKLNKPVVATCDAHYTNEEDAIYRRILLSAMKYKDLGVGGLYFRTTEEMLEEFKYLGEEKAYEVVVTNSLAVADEIEELSPVPRGKFPPHIDNSEKILRDSCYNRAYEIYGNPLPEPIEERLAKELKAIIDEGYAVMYVSAKMLVDKSISDGYLVGSRGSVGSSFAATMAGITEVNPLPPHYICPTCKKLIWGNASEYDCGIDMEAIDCPQCGTDMQREGFTIPFETFLGIPGKIKEPDIDLNFAGEYQSTAHKFVDEIFGAQNVFKAGTIGTLAEKMARGNVLDYCRNTSAILNNFEQERLALGLEGVRKSTGQHPGGIIIVPEGHEIYEFCPVQRPANKTDVDIVTTHFDYHAIDQNLLKLDILGHDAPSIIRHLQDMTGIDPMDVPLKDENVDKIFLGTESLNIKNPKYKFKHGSYGIPEFGTDFVRKMLDDVKPDKFADLVRISGFSHGTDVWKNNAQDYIKKGIANMHTAISTRDDIMNYLVQKDVPGIPAFTIMEKVRKGKGVSDEEAELMKSKEVPQWYIDSCRKISYMFPRAHAVAYVIMSYRIAYFKVYYPAEFYAAFFTTKLADFNWEVAKKDSSYVYKYISMVAHQGNEASQKVKNEATVLELVYEMLSRGISFQAPGLKDSNASRFYVKDGKVVVPIQGIAGIGENCAKAIIDAYNDEEFSSIEDFRKRTKTNKTNMENLSAEGIFKGLSRSDQLELF